MVTRRGGGGGYHCDAEFFEGRGEQPGAVGEAQSLPVRPDCYLALDGHRQFLRRTGLQTLKLHQELRVLKLFALAACANTQG